MYGMINRAVKGLLTDLHGEETWTRIRELAGVDEEEFLSMEQYPDETTYRLVGASSEVLGIPADQVLEAFGEYWIKYTAEAGYGEVMRAAGKTLPEFLANLDELHTRIRFGMPHLRPPSFSVNEESDGTLVLRYVSEREGLAPLVVGLVKGLAERFGEQVEITLSSQRLEDRPYDEFRIVRTPAAASS